MIGADVARSTPVRNCFGTGRTFTWNHSRKQDGWVSIRGRRPRFERRPEAVSEDYTLHWMPMPRDDSKLANSVDRGKSHENGGKVKENGGKSRKPGKSGEITGESQAKRGKVKK